VVGVVEVVEPGAGVDVDVVGLEDEVEVSGDVVDVDELGLESVDDVVVVVEDVEVDVVGDEEVAPGPPG
jgi:hypothetical protein